LEILYIAIRSILGGVYSLKIKSTAKATLPAAPQDFYLTHKNNLSLTEKCIEKHILALQKERANPQKNKKKGAEID
jgi:hypothetical protein